MNIKEIVADFGVKLAAAEKYAELLPEDVKKTVGYTNIALNARLALLVDNDFYDMGLVENLGEQVHGFLSSIILALVDKGIELPKDIDFGIGLDGFGNWQKDYKDLSTKMQGEYNAEVPAKYLPKEDKPEEIKA